MQTHTSSPDRLVSRPIAYTSRHHAYLPVEYSKTALINLVTKTAKPVGMTSTELRVMQRIAEKTRASDYHSQKTSPICHERQSDMANDIGLSTAQWRRCEQKLENLGLISRDTGANGYRGGCAGPDGRRIRAGLSLEPLIERREALEALKEQGEDLKEQERALRLEISLQRRRLSRVALAFPEHPISTAILKKKAAWRRPRDYPGIEALKKHNKELDDLVQDSADLQVVTPPWYANMSGGARAGERRHIQHTIDNRSVISSETPSTEPSVVSSNKPQNSTAKLSGDIDLKNCSESRRTKTDTSEKTRHTDSLTFEQIENLASAELRFYLDNLYHENRPTRLEDVAFAFDLRATELGISASCLNLSRAVMGYRDASLALMVIDQNTNHPTHPVRNPSALIRTFIAKYEAGTLDLSRSIHGIWGRVGKNVVH